MRAQDPAIAGLILTSYDDEQALTAAVLAGAVGYLLKDIQGTTVATIRARSPPAQLLAPQEVEALQESLAAAPVDPRLRSLTPQERRILSIWFALKGLTNRQIGGELFLAEKTVKNYITAVLAKLGMERSHAGGGVRRRARGRTRRPSAADR